MKSIHVIIGAALGFMLALALNIPSAHAENRPSELGLFTMLNGEQSRELNASPYFDGGGLTLFSMDAGPGCNNVATGAVYEMHCNTAGHFCAWGSDGGTGGSFCQTAIGSPSYGRPVNASTPAAPAPYWFTTKQGTQGETRSVCIIPKAGDVTMTCALFRMR